MLHKYPECSYTQSELQGIRSTTSLITSVSSSVRAEVKMSNRRLVFWVWRKNKFVYFSPKAKTHNNNRYSYSYRTAETTWNWAQFSPQEVFHKVSNQDRVGLRSCIKRHYKNMYVHWFICICISGKNRNIKWNDHDEQFPLADGIYLVIMVF